MTIFCAEYKCLYAHEKEQAQIIISLTLQNEWILEQLKLSKKKLCGCSSEQVGQMVMGHLGLTMNKLEAYAFGTEAARPEQVAVKAHARKWQSGDMLEVVLEGIPAEVVEYRLPEEEFTCSACVSRMVEVGKEVRRALQMILPHIFWVSEAAMRGRAVLVRRNL